MIRHVQVVYSGSIATSPHFHRYFRALVAIWLLFELIHSLYQTQVARPPRHVRLGPGHGTVDESHPTRVARTERWSELGWGQWMGSMDGFLGKNNLK